MAEMLDIDEKWFEVFTPGRLCILGEHTDYAGEYIHQNSELSTGATIVCTTNEGLHAKCRSLNCSSIRFVHCQSSDHDREVTVELPMEIDKLKDIASLGQFHSYVAGTAAAVMESAVFASTRSSDCDSTSPHSSHQGIEINNYRTTLPMKKGLSSSAAVCVLIARCFAAVFDLTLSLEQLMEIAYRGEMYTPSRCGRMDQCVAMGQGVGIMHFINSSCRLQPLPCKVRLYFVVADLRASKDTVVILRDLNACFPIPKNPTQALMVEYVKGSLEIIQRATVAIEQGDVLGLGRCMCEAQSLFDRCAIPNCPSQLTAPVLHALMDHLMNASADSDELGQVREGILAVKGIGSQGDGSAQILCADQDSQEKVFRYLTEKKELECFTITIPSTILQQS